MYQKIILSYKSIVRRSLSLRFHLINFFDNDFFLYRWMRSRCYSFHR